MSVSDLVGEIEDVRRRTRRASSGAAVPLALLGLLVAGAAPVYGAAGDSLVGGPEEDGVFYLRDLMTGPSFVDGVLRVHPNVSNYHGIGYYWLIAAPLVFLAIAGYYVWRAHRTGLSVNGGRVAVVGAAAFGFLVTAMYLGGRVTDPGLAGDGLRAGNFLNPFLVVAVAVFALAWVERSAGVVLAGVTFLTAVLIADIVVYSDLREGWEYITSWGFATLLLGAVLLVWAAVIGVVQRARRA